MRERRKYTPSAQVIILRTLETNRKLPPMTLDELREQTGVFYPTLRSILSQLARVGYVQNTKHGHWKIVAAGSLFVTKFDEEYEKGEKVLGAGTVS